jgi:hypothetical protein
MTPIKLKEERFEDVHIGDEFYYADELMLKTSRFGAVPMNCEMDIDDETICEVIEDE